MTPCRVKGTPLLVPPCLFFISGCSPFKVASGRALASAVRNTYCGQGFSAHQGRQSSAHARFIRARHCGSTGVRFKKSFPISGKAGNRDSIRSKVFEGDREGVGEGKGCLSPERHPFPSPIFPHQKGQPCKYVRFCSSWECCWCAWARRWCCRSGCRCGMGTGRSSACSRRWRSWWAAGSRWRIPTVRRRP